jgi:hypothetical protein
LSVATRPLRQTQAVFGLTETGKADKSNRVNEEAVIGCRDFYEWFA